MAEIRLCEAVTLQGAGHPREVLLGHAANLHPVPGAAKPPAKTSNRQDRRFTVRLYPGSAGILPAPFLDPWLPRCHSPERTPKPPIFRLGHQSGCDGVAFDVGDNLVEMVLIADEPVVVLAKPKRPGTTKFFVGLRGRE